MPYVNAPKPKNNANKTIAVVLAVLIVFGAFVWVFAGSDTEQSYQIDVQTTTEGTKFELSGDFLLEKDIFTVSLMDDERIAFALNGEIASNYSYYEWRLFNHDRVSSTSAYSYVKYNGDTIRKAEPVLYYLSKDVGEFDVSVTCYTESDGRLVASGAYSGKV
ncbi:MAG: hypothetical protein LBR42_04900, partial [Candidatus Methanoplasma sp.]|nr:hypothetical protein [Candidatus Methanoplasma sp.]